MREYRSKNVRRMLNILRVIVIGAVILGVVEKSVPIWVLLAAPIIYFIPEILLFIWWGGSFIATGIVIGISFVFFSPLFLISWVVSKYDDHKRNKKH